MQWHVFIYDWLMQASLSTLLVLLAGAVAVLCVRQPVRRIRLIELTLIGCLIVPWLGLIPGYPRLFVPGWPTATDQLPTGSGESSRLPNPRLLDSFSSEHSPPVNSTDNESAPAHTYTISGLSRKDARLWIVTAYLTGVAAMSLWWVIGLFGLIRAVWSARPASRQCRAVIRRLAGHYSDRVVLLESKQSEQAFTFAWYRPVIILPAKFCQAEDSKSLSWCLAHEWSHVRHYDTWSWLLANVTRLVFFFQPLLWWLRGQLRLYQNYLADAQAAQQSAQPEDYAEFLTRTVFTSTLSHAPVGLGIAGQRSELYRRVIMLVQDQFTFEDRCSRRFSLLTALVGLALVSLVSAVAAPRNAVAAKPGDVSINQSKAVDTDETDSDAQASSADEPNGPIDADAEARRVLRSAGLRIEDDDDGKVIAVSATLESQAISVQDFAYIKNLNWSQQRSTKEEDMGDWIDVYPVPAVRIGSTVTDAHLEPLAGIAELRTLDLYEAGVTDQGVKHLKGLKNLERLFLRGTQVTHGGLAHLVGMQRLTSLNLAKTKITDAGLVHLKGMQHLEELWLNGNDITDAGLTKMDIRHKTKLKLLHLGATGITNEGLKQLENLTDLEWLWVHHTKITGRGLNSLNRLTKLESLNLANTQVDDASLAYLQHLNGLRELTLWNTQIKGEGLIHLQHLKSLATLVLMGTQVDNDDLASLKPFTSSLKQLALGGTQVDNDGLASLKPFTNLQYLFLSDTKINDEGLVNLLGFTDLTFLHLANTQVTDAGLGDLKRLPKLTYLNLTGTGVTDAAVKDLHNSLSKCEIVYDGGSLESAAANRRSNENR